MRKRVLREEMDEKRPERTKKRDGQVAEPPSIFNKKATETLRNPDDLDKFVRVTNPSVWVVLVACVMLVVGLLAWGVFGAVTTSVSGMGVVIDGEAMCFLPAEDATKVDEGDAASIGGKSVRVEDVSAVPLSRDEADKVLDSDYLVSALVKDDWAYKVVFDGDVSTLPNGVPIVVSITVERVAPITLVLGGTS